MKIKKWIKHFLIALRIRFDFYRLKRLYSNSQNLKIQFGCGDKPLPNWTNTDLIPSKRGIYALEVRKKMPFATNSVAFIFCEHLIEHLTKKESISFLKECFRILKPGGVIRIGWPELSCIISAYSHSNSETWDTGNPESETLGDKVNDSFYLYGHKYIYDNQTLELVMQRIGFVNYRQMPWGVSAFPELNAIEQRADAKVHVIEAEKPKGA